MDKKAGHTESWNVGRPYSPSDVMTYDFSSDESVARAKIGLRSISKSSSSSSDPSEDSSSSSDDNSSSSGDSSSSYEYHWEEAKPVTPPFEPFVVSVNIGSMELPAIKRECTTVVPMKAISKVSRPRLQYYTVGPTVQDLQCKLKV